VHHSQHWFKEIGESPAIVDDKNLMFPVEFLLKAIHLPAKPYKPYITAFFGSCLGALNIKKSAFAGRLLAVCASKGTAAATGPQCQESHHRPRGRWGCWGIIAQFFDAMKKWAP